MSEVKRKNNKEQEDWIMVSGQTEYPQWIDWDKTNRIIGVITDIRYAESLNKYVITIESVNGEKYSIGETGLLKLRDLKVGMQIRIDNQGWERLKNGRRARKLILYVKEPF